MAVQPIVNASLVKDMAMQISLRARLVLFMGSALIVTGCAPAVSQGAITVTPSPNPVPVSSPFPAPQSTQHPMLTATPALIRVGQALSINGTGFLGNSVKLWIVPYYNFRMLPGEPTPPGPDAGLLGETSLKNGTFSLTITIQASYNPTPTNGTLKLYPSTFQIWAIDDRGILNRADVNVTE
jgi:hypothetical protein